MIKFSIKIQDKKASAILIAIMITTVLMVAGLSINRLIVKEMIGGRDLLNASKAYYLAEAATENALYEVHKHIPGYQSEDKTLVNKFVVSDDKSFQYKITSRAETGSNVFPCKNIAKDDWRILPLQEAVRIPLYSYKFGNVVVPNSHADFKDFKVQFYLPGYAPTESEIALMGDVLEWKLIGLRNDNSRTEAMSEYVPLKSAFNFASAPTSFGVQGTNYKVGKYKDETGFFTFDYSIAQFLQSHKFNYLVLTNIIDSSKAYNQIHSNSDIRFRIIGSNNPAENLVCEYVKINAEGIVGKFKQNIDIDLRLDTFLPVFDFAMYRTKN